MVAKAREHGDVSECGLELVQDTNESLVVMRVARVPNAVVHQIARHVNVADLEQRSDCEHTHQLLVLILGDLAFLSNALKSYQKLGMGIDRSNTFSVN